ncbi:MAG: hypothetical protein SV377_05780 [Halobacteria archaeon]|nr:hypothetical protein [Halobacteria archaeon]
MKVLILDGPREVVEAFEEACAEVSVIKEIGEKALIEGGIDDADVFIVFGGENAVQVTVGKHVNSGFKAILVGEDIPDYVRRNADLILSPNLADPETLVDVVLGED